MGKNENLFQPRGLRGGNMELIRAINTRRTVRDFADEEIPDPIIKKALEAGLKAPSYNHQKQWDFILVKSKAIRLQLTQTEEMKDKIWGYLYPAKYGTG